MTKNTQLLLARIASVPVLLLLPLIFMPAGLLIAAENRGDSFPLFATLGGLGGAAAAIILARRTLFAPHDSPPARCFRSIGLIVLVEVVTIILATAFAQPS